jgi:predicted 3-demethylubiquinone-9 3-methyltransferase (glyoxalase superfamily)
MILQLNKLITNRYKVRISLQKITTNLWFDGKAEEAVSFYTSIFKDSKIGNVLRYGKEGFEFHGMPEGTVMTIDFVIMGQHFVALNGGSQFKFNESISFIIRCENQAEVDYYWERLGEGGDENAKVCG